MKRVTTSVFFWLLLGSLFVLSPRIAQAQSQYQINLNFQTTQGLLNGEMQLTYRNTTGQALKSLLFRLDANAQAKMDIQEVKAQDGLVLPAHPYRYTYLDQEVEDPLIYEIFLPAALQPNQKVELHIRYSISRLPRSGRSYFLIDDPNKLGLGSWYPRLMSFKDGRWIPGYNANSAYTVSARINGKLFAISPVAPVSIASDARAYRYTADQVQGMDLIITPDLLLRTKDLQDFQIRFYYPGKLQKWSVLTLEIVEDVLRYFKKRYGAYPASSLTLVGMEESKYPVIASNRLVLLSQDFDTMNDAEIRARLREWIAYGIAQQYWGIRVQDAGEYPPWITQGIALYLTQSYLQTKPQQFEWGKELTQSYLKAAHQGWNTSLKTPQVIFQRMPFDSFTALGQGKGFTVFRLLDILLGKRVLEKAEINLQQRFVHKTITPQALMKEIEAVSGKELGWFFKQWTEENFILDYGIQSLQVSKAEKGYQATVTVQRLGEAIMPVSITLVLKNGEQQFRLWNGESRSESLSFNVPAEVIKVKLDASGVTPDIDRSNNEFEND